ncbi:MAG: hypothetical protein ACRDLF_16805, partial [Solirubrobacteraceae bacterium]
MSTVNAIQGRPRTKLVQRAATMRRALLAACALMLCLPAAVAAGASSTLSTAEYQTRPVCPAPAPGRASCLSLELVL